MKLSAAGGESQNTNNSIVVCFPEQTAIFYRREGLGWFKHQSIPATLGHGVMVTFQTPLVSFGLLAKRTFPKNLAPCRPYSSCPFQVLGLNSKRSCKSTTDRVEDGVITYNQVRVAFRELAFKYHPDTSSGDTEKNLFE